MRARMAGLRAAGLIGTALAAGLATGMAAPAWSQSAAADDPLAACASISSRSARLACYDNAARHHVPPPAPRVAAAPPAQAGRAEPAPIARGFGAERVRDTRPKAQRPQPVMTMTARLVSATDNGIGHWRFVLADGAVWQMELADPHFLPPSPGETVRIRRAAIGSYLMDVGHQGSVRVTRVR